MMCTTCSEANPVGAAFCMKCGAELAVGCSRCGAELPAEAAFCMKCGHRVADEALVTSEGDGGLRKLIPRELMAKLESAARDGAMQGERRTVTMLFCDVQGSTTAAEHLDPEEWAEIMNGAFEHLIPPVYRYEGTLARLMGDAILAFFGAPIGHEDDPERAVRAGLEILKSIRPYRQEVSRRWGVDFDIRVGINTGLVVVGAVGSDMRVEYTAMGDAVNVAARMEQTAAPGTVQVSGATRALVNRLFEFEPLGMIEVKGRSQPVEAHRVNKAIPRPETIRGIEGLHAPMVGRAGELDRLRLALDQVASGQGRIVSVQGEAGLGKSRLVIEARQALDADGIADGLRWATGRALSYETSVPLASATRLVRRLVGVDDEADGVAFWRAIEALARDVLPGGGADVAAFIGAAFGAQMPVEVESRVSYLDPPKLRAEAFRAVGEMVGATAERTPVVAVFEDLHWADSASIDLAKQMLELVETVPLALILVFRPRRNEPSWEVHEAAVRDHAHVYESIELGALPAEQARLLVSSLLNIDGLPDGVRESILSRSEGNPFYLEEVIRSMMDHEVIVRDGEKWVATSEIMSMSVPETLLAVITTRLDRLDEGARRAVQAASVLGREFRYDELSAVLTDRTDVDSSLIELQRRDILTETARIPKRTFRFRHALMQEAVYQTVLLRTRTEWHALIADFLERIHPERAEEIAGHHLSAREPDRALPHVLESGSRALAAYAIPEAIDRFEQALAILDAQEEPDPHGLRVVLEGLGRSREMRFDFEGAEAAYRRLRAEGERRGNLAMALSGRNKAAFMTGMVFADPESALVELAATEAAARASDEGSGLAEACMYQCYLRTARGEFGDVEYYMTELSRLGEESGDIETILFGMVHLANTLMYATEADRAIERGEKALARAEEAGHLKFQAEVLTTALPFAHLQRGEIEAALAYVERGMEIATRIGDHTSETMAAIVQGKLAMSQGYYSDALALFRRAEAASRLTGVPFYITLGRCVTGTCYSSIGGPLQERAAQIHTETLELADLPMGDLMGAWVWSEIGHCCMAAGKFDKAEEMFRLALDRRTVPMYMSRPDALAGMCDIAIERGELDEAHRWLEELRTYVAARSMRNTEVVLILSEGKVAAAEGDHVRSLARFDEALEHLEGGGFARTELDVHAARIHSLVALDDSEGALRARGEFERVVGVIVERIGDDELRIAFGQGALDMIEGG